MTITEPPLYEKARALLEADAAGKPFAATLRVQPTGFLAVFLPETAGRPAEWKAVLADLADAAPLLNAAGIGIIACTPPFDPAVFADGTTLPFPLLPLAAGAGLSCELYQLLRGVDHCNYSQYAVLVDPAKDQAVKSWRDVGASALVPEILAYLVDKDTLVFSPSAEIVIDCERDHIAGRRTNAVAEGVFADAAQAQAYDVLMTSERQPIGMSFSGGGIRAATFTLGVSQALARYRFLPWVDYFTSVSGGGFSASNLTSLLTRSSGGKFHFNTQWEKFPYNPQIEAFRAPDDLDDATSFSENRNYRDVSYSPGANAQLAHLFKKANYLIPRLGLANRDLLRGLGALLPGMGFTFLLFLLAVAAAAGFHYFAAGLAAPTLLGDTVLPEAAARRLALIFWGNADGGYGPGGVFLDLLLSGAAAGLFVYWFLVAQYSFPISRKMRGRAAPAKPAPSAPAPAAPAAAGEVPGRLRLRYAFYLVLFLLSGGLAGYSLWQIAGGGLFPDLDLAIPPAIIFIVSLAVALWALDPLLVASLQAGRARAGNVTLGAVFPHPRTLVPLVLLFLLQTGLAFTLLWPRLSPAGWWVPIALGAAAVLLLLLFNRVFGQGIIVFPRWATAGIIFLLIGLGAVLAGRTMIAPGIVCDGCMPWTFLTAAAVIFVVLGAVVYRHQAAIWGRDGLDRWERYDRFVLFCILAFEIGALLLAMALARVKGGEALADRPFWIWGPVVFLAGMLGVFTFIRMVITGRRETWGSARFRTMVWAVIGMKTYVIAAAALFALLAVPHMFSIENTNTPGAAVPLTTAIVSGLWAIFLARFSGTETAGEGLLTRLLALPAGIRNAVLGLLVVVFWVSLAFLAETLLDRVLPDPLQALGAAFIALGLLLLVGILLNYNFLSPHYFFGDRVVDVFLRTDYETADGRVVALRDESRYPLQSICQKDSSVPYHLVVTAINLAGSGHLQDRDRKSRHFIFSRKFVGSNATGYAQTSVYRGGSTRYGSTIAVSGAAASPGLGTFTFFAQSFMMTLFNVRLGQWWLNPKEYAGQRLSDDDLAKLEDYESKAFWPLYLWDEAFARTTARRKLVNLTDGGHTRDNGGIYPLFERRCKIIVAGDASQDEQGLCRDLFSVIHYARLDLGIEVEINIGCLKPAGEGEDGRIPGMSERHIAVGRIHYPAVHRRDGSLKHPAEDGWLIYVKPAISPAAPAEILQFWETDKVAFPHPTTADQFFSERQFEAQRRLGEESIKLSLLALRAAYRNGEIRDPGGVKRRFLRGAMDRGEVDFALLQRKPGLVDVILRDLMKTVSPLP